MIIILLIIYILLFYYYTETFEDIYDFKVSQYFKKMFEQPTIWLGNQDFDGNKNYNKLYINNYNNMLFKEKNV